MSIADYFEKPPARTQHAAFDAGAARRQFRQALWLIGVILAVAFGAFVVRTPTDRDVRPRGAHAVGAAQAEREAGHGPANFGGLPARLKEGPPGLRQSFDDTQIAQAELAPR
jgi:hypothetical protein